MTRVGHAGWQGADGELALIQQQLDPTQQGKIGRERLLRWLTNYYNAEQVMERVQNEKAAQAKRDTGAGADPVVSRASTADEIGPSNQIHRPDAEPDNLPSCTPSPFGSGVDWDAQYQRALSDPSIADPFVRGLQLAELVNRFRESAELFVHKIIEELGVPEEEKAIRPVPPEDHDEFLATDGLAVPAWLDGNLARYHHEGMLVYIILAPKQSSAVSPSPSEVLDANETHERFRSILKHQLDAAQALQNALQASSQQQYRLSVPLQCTVDYLGFCCFVVASSTTRTEASRSLSSLGISRSTKGLIKGNLQDAFDRMGLLSETPGRDHGREDGEMSEDPALPSFVPIEVGCSMKLDGDVQVIALHNLAGLFPPVLLDDNGTSTEADLLQSTWGCLRREFVLQHGSYIPLSSCARSIAPTITEAVIPSTVGARDLTLSQLALRSACDHLIEVVIPGFMADLEATSLNLVHSQELSEALHASGINIKFLGRCFTLATRADIRRLILCEMVARAAKVELGAFLRAVVYESVASSSSGASRQSTVVHSANDGDVSRNSNNDDNNNNSSSSSSSVDTTGLSVAVDDAQNATVHQSATRVCVDFFNLLFGVASNPDSMSFWKNRILPRVRNKFALHGDYPELTFEAISSGESIHLPQLLHAVQVQTNATIRDHMGYNFRSPLPVSEQDLISIEMSSKLSSTLTTECEEILVATDEFIACGQLEAALDNVKLRLTLLNLANRSGESHRVMLSHYLTCAADLSLRLNRSDDAREYVTLAEEVAPNSHAVIARALTVAMTLDGRSQDVAIAERCFSCALSAVRWHLGPSSLAQTDIFMTMVDVCASAGEFERAETLLEDCARLTRQALGSRSLPSADIRRRQAMLMHHRWQSVASPIHDEQVMGVLLDAIAIYERHLSSPASVSDEAQLKSLAASCYYLMAEIARDDQDAYNMALKALTMRKDSLPSAHEDILASSLQLAAVAGRVGEPFRAIEYYREALAILKQSVRQGSEGEADTECGSMDCVDRIRDVSRDMLQLFLGSLSSEQQDIVEKTKQRHALLWAELGDPDAVSSQKSDAMSVVVRNLFVRDPVEYVAWLMDRVDHEALALGRHVGAHHSPALSTTRLATRTPSGDVTLGLQLALVLFLAQPSTSEASTV